MISVGVDIGGTFTDFTLYDHDSGTIYIEKCLTHSSSPEDGIIEGIKALIDKTPDLVERCSKIKHATTLVTNAILERRGVKTALLATEGFRDIIEQRRESRYNVYDLFLTFPEPVVERDLRLGIRERTYSNGKIGVDIDVDQIKDVARFLKAEGVQSVAISFLHSYENPSHERIAREVLKAVFPELFVSLSHEVTPEPGEYERTSTTILDAYVKPIVGNYLDRLDAKLRHIDLSAGIEIMLSNGASTTASIAATHPIQLIESGPSAGVEAAIWLCRETGVADALSFDMGGTTAKLCVIQDGLAERAREFEAGRVHRFVAGSGMPVKVPVYGLIEIGAGGGSIAKIDKLGLIAVGPESAGADPGPACYGLGGSKPTITDADLVLGLIHEDQFLGGEIKLNRQAAIDAIVNEVGRPLSLTPEAAAYAIFDVVNETMAAAARLYIAEKGRDLKKLSLIAFGGAGPVHGIELARKLGCPRVILPPYAGVMSSFGLLAASSAFEKSKPVYQLIDGLSADAIACGLQEIKQGIAETINANVGEVDFAFFAQMQNYGQNFPISVKFSFDEDRLDIIGYLKEAFIVEYSRLYGRIDNDVPIELVSLSAVGSVGDKIDIRPSLMKEARFDDLPPRLIYDPATRSRRETKVVWRSSLTAGDEIAGPVVVQERESSFVIGPGDRLNVHPSGAIFVELGGQS